jgi:hypothetical protein
MGGAPTRLGVETEPSQRMWVGLRRLHPTADRIRLNITNARMPVDGSPSAAWIWGTYRAPGPQGGNHRPQFARVTASG